MRLLCAFAVAAACAGLPQPASPPVQGTVSNALIKAVYLLNFARFTEWPAGAVKGPLTLCVLGDPDVAASLDSLIGDRTINGRDVSVARIETFRIVRSCHVLFVSGDDPARASDALDAVASQHVFTVGEGELFARTGGVAALFTEDSRPRFGINPEALNRAGLRVSSKMLGLARLIKAEPR
ncbi:MAG TPA: YfiR family protein [Vicinamibacterales bacterium]|nr:YfiR family protein [Vicinamibacterales bacterium]